ncbi:MAG: hypothetical protein KatS3mg131_1893 [Candidatus Tectimicrobiota bacterium]|nr:MAG: hypothetical protein KatS3mg131_1893 [Candidatus Tectomicrobia bacterium]
MTSPPKHPNRLIHETSPYLRQHAYNPVDWYPWGPEALAKARAEDKPILLSIGYSACHWCHVMERECFENEAIAALMNAHFVNIKVDREERPDLDHLYQSVVQLMTGQGGWPLTVFLTPEQEPFYGGTYFPPDDRYGRPGFPRVLRAVAEAYRQRRGDIAASVQQIREGPCSGCRRLPLRGKPPSPRSFWRRLRGGCSARWTPCTEALAASPSFPTPPTSSSCCATGTAAATSAFSTW